MHGSHHILITQPKPRLQLNPQLLLTIDSGRVIGTTSSYLFGKHISIVKEGWHLAFINVECLHTCSGATGGVISSGLRASGGATMGMAAFPQSLSSQRASLHCTSQPLVVFVSTTTTYFGGFSFTGHINPLQIHLDAMAAAAAMLFLQILSCSRFRQHPPSRCNVSVIAAAGTAMLAMVDLKPGD